MIRQAPANDHCVGAMALSASAGHGYSVASQRAPQGEMPPKQPPLSMQVDDTLFACVYRGYLPQLRPLACALRVLYRDKYPCSCPRFLPTGLEADL